MAKLGGGRRDDGVEMVEVSLCPIRSYRESSKA